MNILGSQYIRASILILVLFVVAGEFTIAYLTKDEVLYDWIGRPSLNNSGHIWVLVYRQARHHSFDRSSTLQIRFSQDEGITWTSKNTFLDGRPVRGFPLTIHSSHILSDVSGGTLVKTPNGHLLLFVREEGEPQIGTYVWRSTDEGASWIDEGKINNDNTLLMGGQAVVVGGDLYATFWVDANADYQPPFKTVLYKSADDGRSWIHVSDVASEGTVESALVYLGGNELLVVLTDDVGAQTYIRKSKDLGRSWGELQDATDMLGVMGRPKIQTFSNEPNRLYLYGRDVLKELNYTVVYYSDNQGITWSKKFYPDATSYPDTGYSTLTKRTDGNFYMLSYGGTHQQASLKVYVFSSSAIEKP